MPFVKRLNTLEAEQLLSELANAGTECERLEHALEKARAHRDELARQASRAGATRRDVAAAARLSPGRVQQLASG